MAILPEVAPLKFAPGINLLKGQVSSGFCDWNELSISWGVREDGELISLAQTYCLSLDKAGRTSAVDLQAWRLTVWCTFSVAPSLEQDLVHWVVPGDVQGAVLGLSEPKAWAGAQETSNHDMERSATESYPKGNVVDSCLWVPTIWPSKMALCALPPRIDTSRRAPTRFPWRKHICKRTHQWHMFFKLSD